MFEKFMNPVLSGVKVYTKKNSEKLHPGGKILPNLLREIQF